MSEQYPGGFVTKTPPTPSGPYYNSTAQGIWTLTQQAQLTVQSIWPTAGNNPPIYWIMTIAPPTAGSYTTISTQQNNVNTDSSGNFYPVFGMSPQAGPYPQAWNISKIDINGNLIFTKSYHWGGADQGSLYNGTVNSSGDVFNQGYSSTSSQPGFYSKFNSSGVAQFNFETVNTGLALTNFAGIDSSNNLYITGQNGSGHGVWIKTNSSGAIQASTTVLSSRPYAYLSFGSVNSSGIYIGGGSTIYEGFLIRMQNSGSVTYFTTLGTGYGGGLVSAAVDPTYSFIYAAAYAPSVYTWALWKVDASNGTSVSWSRYSSDLLYYYHQVNCDSSGNVYCFTQPSGASSTVTILKFNSSGTLQWQRNLVYTGATITPTSIAIDNTNSAFLVTIGQNSTPNRAVVFRLPLDGSQTGTYGSWAYSASSYTISSGASGSWSGSSYSTGSGVTSTTSTPTIANTTFIATTAKIA